ncbi:MAG TPA: hypothetical protein VGR97_10825 [Candidatus Acidoferrales bacterium]|nr:hypothetical protein [Candidatus Acidoferrales bacterium]
MTSLRCRVIYEWLNRFMDILQALGTIEALLLALGIIYAVVLWARGIAPALLRLGNGLAKRKIALFAKSDNVASLRNLLTDSKLFRPSNICEISRREDIGRCESATIFLVFWPDWEGDIAEILSKKRDECALIVYMPYDRGRIPDESMRDLDGKRHTTVTNFRGRLLSDIVTSMITTSYEKE